jgi:nucleotide-binding universal stress UspA family protein
MMKRILVATDFSESSQAAVRYALELAATSPKRIILLHVVEGDPDRLHLVGGLPSYLTESFISDDGVLAFRPSTGRVIRRDLCEEAYWKLATLFPPSARNRVRPVVTVGKPAAEIVRVANEQGVDLIILGSGGRTGLRRLWRRAVADKVKRRTSIPVMTMDVLHSGFAGEAGPAATPYPHVVAGAADVQEENGIAAPAGRRD